MSTVYLSMSTDVIHGGHMNIIQKAAELGELTVGVLTDEVVASYKRFPLLTYDERVKIISNIKGVAKVIPQDTLSYKKNLETLKPDYLVESASPAAMRELALPALKNGTSVITLSIGALADETFYREVAETAKVNGTRIYIASGATGGFDVLRTASLMGNTTARFFNEKGPNALKGTPVYDDSLQTEQRTVFSGSAAEAIRLFPTKVNVTVAASRASVGPENMQVSIQSTPGFVGDTQRVEIKNDQVHAVVDIYSATSDIAGWSVVSTLINIASPIVF